jgi:hypothetical protein
VDLTGDSFRALARSSPWRWSTLHLVHRSGLVSEVAGEHVEAWLARPDGVRIVGPGGRRVRNSLPEQRPDGRPTGPWRPPEPAYRPDGLVARRPGDPWAQTMLCDDLFWGNYYWVAMLDPVELSHHVDVSDLHEDEVAGRPVWRARLAAVEGYEPRCGGNCCELLYSEVGLRCDFPNPDDVPEEWRGRPYPDGYDVALDAATGVVVRSHPVGGDPARAPWVENDILEVDAGPVATEAPHA